jgi:nicotinamide phosphoribosyltransferase
MKKVLETRKRKVTKTVTDELNGIRGLLGKYPSGILSMVSDTFDLWRMCTEYLPALKEEIMSRDGKLVIRPDSGDPADILCGMRVMTEEELNKFVYTDEYGYKENGIVILKDGVYYEPEVNHWSDGSIDWAGADMDGKIYNEHEVKGVIELLWDVFGGTINEQGYKVLDPHIGAIYGDSITIDRADEICKRLEAKGFASTNVVLGIGSFTYQYNTRDTFGFAMKATYVEVNGEGREIFKDPITDDGTKKSATGLLTVHNHDGEYVLIDHCTWAGEASGDLQTIYKDGGFHNQTTLEEIRKQLK